MVKFYYALQAVVIVHQVTVRHAQLLMSSIHQAIFAYYVEVTVLVANLVILKSVFLVCQEVIDLLVHLHANYVIHSVLHVQTLQQVVLTVLLVNIKVLAHA